jgi:hypothetical protein
MIKLAVKIGSVPNLYIFYMVFLKSQERVGGITDLKALQPLEKTNQSDKSNSIFT